MVPTWTQIKFVEFTFTFPCQRGKACKCQVMKGVKEESVKLLEALILNNRWAYKKMSNPNAATVKQFVQCIAASTSSTSFQVCQGLGSVGFA